MPGVEVAGVYQYTCRCDQRYVGRTGQRLKTRVEQHIPRHVREAANLRDKKQTTKGTATNSLQPPTTTTSSGRPQRRAKLTKTPSGNATPSDHDLSSSIAKHLIENPLCAQMYNHSQFNIIATARTDFHLRVLEAVFIQSLKPVLCRQKTFVYECLLF